MKRQKTWLRLYTEILDDYDVNLLNDADFRMLVKLWCLARMSDGMLPSVDRIAFRLRLPEPKVRASVSTLINAGYLEEIEGILTPHNWRERQFESDTSTERMRRFRKRHCDGVSDVTCDVTVTAGVTATDTDTYTEPPIVPHRGTSVRGSVRDHQRGWFDEFWSLYPRKTAKKAGEAKFRTQCKTEEQFGVIMAALRAQLPGMLAKEAQYRPHPATWLSQGRWMDEPDAPIESEFYDGYEITGRPRCQ